MVSVSVTLGLEVVAEVKEERNARNTLAFELPWQPEASVSITRDTWFKCHAVTATPALCQIRPTLLGKTRARTWGYSDALQFASQPVNPALCSFTTPARKILLLPRHAERCISLRIFPKSLLAASDYSKFGKNPLLLCFHT